MKYRLLLVDHDKHLNVINEKVLLSSGIISELHITSNGKEALDYLTFRAQRGYALPDIIIFDIQLPILNGFEFVDAFRQLEMAGKSKIELVVFTNSSNPKEKSKAHAMGIKYFLNKPYLLRNLYEIIHHMNTAPKRLDTIL